MCFDVGQVGRVLNQGFNDFAERQMAERQMAEQHAAERNEQKRRRDEVLALFDAEHGRTNRQLQPELPQLLPTPELPVFLNPRIAEEIKAIGRYGLG